MIGSLKRDIRRLLDLLENLWSIVWNPVRKRLGDSEENIPSYIDDVFKKSSSYIKLDEDWLVPPGLRLMLEDRVCWTRTKFYEESTLRCDHDFYKDRREFESMKTMVKHFRYVRYRAIAPTLGRFIKNSKINVYECYHPYNIDFNQIPIRNLEEESVIIVSDNPYELGSIKCDHLIIKEKFLNRNEFVHNYNPHFIKFISAESIPDQPGFYEMVYSDAENIISNIKEYVDLNKDSKIHLLLFNYDGRRPFAYALFSQLLFEIRSKFPYEWRYFCPTTLHRF